MVSNLRVTILAGAVALALGAPAMANTTLDTTSGDVFINVVDTTTNVSFLYDTGVSQAAFNGSGTYSYTFTSDANYQNFAAQAGGHTLDYSVFSATQVSSGFTTSGEVLFTSNASVSKQVGNNIGNAIVATGGFFTAANGVTSSTTKSAYLPTASQWGQTSYEYTAAQNLGVPFTSVPSGLNALVGTALNFYQMASSDLLAQDTSGTTLAKLAGQWNFDLATGTATYGGSPVPLPTPLLLLLSGLGLMGVVSRRGKGLPGAAAV